MDQLQSSHLGVIRSFSGHGFLEGVGSGQRAGIQFETFETVRGDLWLEATGTGHRLGSVVAGFVGPHRLEGTSSDGLHTIHCELVWVTELRLSGGGASSEKLRARCGEIKIKRIGPERPISTAQALLVNYPSPFASQDAPTSIVHPRLGEINIEFRSTHSPGLSRKMEVGLGISETGLLNVKARDDEQLSESKASDLVDEFCLVSSVQTGTRVQWLTIDYLSVSGETCLTVLRSNKTAPFRSMPRVIRHDVTPEQFFGLAIVRVDEAELLWRFSEAANAFVEAIAPGDSLELQGLKLTSALEILAGAWMRRNRKEYVLDGPFERPLFDDVLRREITAELRRLLRERLGTDKQGREKTSLMLQHVRGLNRYPFRVAVRRLVADTGQRALLEHVDEAVELRNALVHTASFSGGPRRSPPAKLALLAGFVQRLLLGCLDVPETWMEPMRV